MVFQDYALYPHMTVRDNIAYPLKIKHMGRSERSAEAEAAGGNLSLAHLMDRRPAQLSGGQQQRVALARAIATRPRRVPLRRAALQPRRPVAPGGPHVPQATPTRAGDDGDLRHPRPERGAGARRPHGGDGGGRDPPGGHADRVVPPPCERLRRRVHRFDADEPDPRCRHQRRRRRRRQRAAARRRERRRSAAKSSTGSVRSTSTSTDVGTDLRHGVDHREPRHRVPRHRRARRRRAAQGDGRRRARSRSPATRCRSLRRAVGSCCTTANQERCCEHDHDVPTTPPTTAPRASTSTSPSTSRATPAASR